MKFESPILTSNESIDDEEEFDPFLGILWKEYDFVGNPPKKGSAAETRLRKTCEEYVTYLDSKHLSGKNMATINVSEGRRRQLHNEIALMVVSKLRSGMTNSLAEKIADFAFEYIKGYKISEAYKFEN